MRGITNMKRFVTVLIVLLMLLTCAVTAFAGGGNGDGTGGGKNKPLALASSSVANGAQNVSQNPEIVLTFNKNVVNFTVRDNNKKCFSLTDENGKSIPIDVIMGDDQVDPDIKRIITIKPKSSLTPGTTYLLKIGGGITSKSGVSIGRDSYISFTVAGKKPSDTPRALGDVDGNGRIEASDARLALRAAVLLERYEAGSAQFIAADVDKNGKLQASDARMILRVSVKLETFR